MQFIIVGKGRFRTNGKTYSSGELVPENVLVNIDPYMRKSHFERGTLRMVDEKEMEKIKSGLESKRNRVHISSMKSDLEFAISCIAKLKDKLSKAQNDVEQIQKELDSANHKKEQIESSMQASDAVSPNLKTGAITENGIVKNDDTKPPESNKPPSFRQKEIPDFTVMLEEKTKKEIINIAKSDFNLDINPIMKKSEIIDILSDCMKSVWLKSNGI